MSLRVSLAGRVSISSGTVRIDEERLPGRQGRLVFAYLVIEQGRSVTRDELAEALWGETPPATWEKALGVIASKLRALLGECGVDGAKVLTSAFGCYRLELPAGSWVDFVAAARGADEAEAALAADQPERAKAEASGAVALARPPLLPGEDGAWVERQRRELANVLDRALDCLGDACLRSGDASEAAKWAREAIALEPFRESGYRRLMRAHAAAGNGAEALRAYERCRRLLDEELGAYPSPETESIYRELLQTTSALVTELGLEPSHELPELEGAMLRRDPELDVPAARRKVLGGARGRRLVATFVGATLLAGVAGLGWWALKPAPGLPPGAWTIGLDIPLSGAAAFWGEPMRDAVQLAVDDANAAGGILGSPLRLEVYDDAGADAPYGQDPERGADNARAMVADPHTIAMIGPLSSNVGAAVLPVTNEAGLLECSPANTSPQLTKPRYGALDLRRAYPDRINYVRLISADDVQGPALASFAFRDLGATVALVVDDTGGGRDIADRFQEAYTELGGRAIRRALNPGADPMTVLAPASNDEAPGVVFFGGFNDTGGAQLRRAMEEAGLGSVPFLSWDGLLDGTGADVGSFIQQVGPGALGSFIAHASMGPHRASFSETFRAAYGSEPDEYAAAAYACTEVIVASLRAIAATDPSAGGLREAVRAYAVDPNHRFETILGTVGFDANGDSIQQFVTFYRVDPSAADGAGDWVIHKLQDFGPPT